MFPKQQHRMLSVVVPAYRQADSIVENVQSLLKVLKTIPYSFEVLVVIDGMTDRAFSKLKKANLPHVRVMAYQENQGKAYALRLGIQAAQGDLVLFIDSGFEIDPAGIAMLLMHMEWYNADVIVGSKRHRASLVNYTASRMILSYGYYYLVRVLFGLNITDTQAGIKMFRKEVITQILPTLVEMRFAGDLEMLVAAKSQGFHRIFDAPIKLNYAFSSVTSAATLSSIFKISLDTLAIWYRFRVTRHYRKANIAIELPKKLWQFPVG